MNHIVDKTVSWLISEELIDSNDLEIYRYGIRQGADGIFNALAVIIEAVILGVLLQGITFLVSYTWLRRYSGGMHAKTSIRCFVYSQIINISVLINTKCILRSSLILWLMVIPAAMIIFMFSPVETKNKPLSQKEREVYGKRARVTLVTLFSIAVLMTLMMPYRQEVCILITILVTSLMMVLEIVKT